MEQASRLYRCPGMWSISHHRTWRERGKFGCLCFFFFFFLALCILCLFCDGHETRTQARLLLKESRSVPNTFETGWKDSLILFRTMAGWGDPWSRGGYPSITGEGVEEDEAKEGFRLPLKSGEPSSLQFCEVLGNFTSVSDHLIFPAVSVHRQDSYIISARRFCSQDSKSCVFSL